MRTLQCALHVVGLEVPDEALSQWEELYKCIKDETKKVSLCLCLCTSSTSCLKCEIQQAVIAKFQRYQCTNKSRNT